MHLSIINSDEVTTEHSVRFLGFNLHSRIPVDDQMGGKSSHSKQFRIFTEKACQHSINSLISRNHSEASRLENRKKS